MKIKPLTKEELINLPEFKEYELNILDTGETIRIRNTPRFCVNKLGPDDIILFTDGNGEKWHVDYHLEGGPYKRRAVF